MDLTYLQDLDYRVFQAMNGLAGRSPLFDAVFVALAQNIIYVMIAGLGVFLFSRRHELEHRTAVIQALASAFLGRAVIVSLIRAIFLRERPFVQALVNQLVYVNPLEGSFPSGHATIMFSLAFSLFFADKRWGAVYVILAVFSSLSRIIVGVHFPLDILGGVAVAAVGVALVKWGFTFWNKNGRIIR